ncbi:MAG: FAD-dependent oxidoreductase [bacterium]
MKRVVIVGGGFAGAYIAKVLEGRFEVTLIDTKDYFEYTPGVLRCVVEPEHIRSVQVLHTHYLRSAHVILGDAITITPTAVQAGHQAIEYDYLVLAMGSKYSLPFKQGNVVFSTRAQVLRESHQRLRDAASVLIVGGGLVGVEMAAEIAWKFPGKKITLVEAGKDIMARNHPRARKLARDWLVKHGVKVVTEELVKEAEGGFVGTAGQKMDVDLAFVCTGIVPNSVPLKEHFSSALTERGFVRVTPALQMLGSQNIFVVGDLNEIPMEKTAQSAELQGEVTAANIIAHASSGNLRTFVPTARPQVISLGKYNGIFTHKWINFSGPIPALMKWMVEWWVMRRYRE